MGMCGHDADAEPIGATFRCGDSTFVEVVAITIYRLAPVKDGDHRIANPAVVRFAVVRFHPHVFGIDSAEMNFRTDLYYRLNILNFRLLPLRERPMKYSATPPATSAPPAIMKMICLFS